MIPALLSSKSIIKIIIIIIIIIIFISLCRLYPNKAPGWKQARKKFKVKFQKNNRLDDRESSFK